MKAFSFIFIVAILLACSTQASAQQQLQTLPRFVSLKAQKAYVRAGPGMQYPFKWVYRRAGLPVEIIQEYDQWRKIRDAEGGEGWINALLLSPKRRVLAAGEGTVDMMDDNDGDARLIARLEPGVLGDLRRCTTDMCEIATGGYTGWVKRNFLWGIYPREELN